MATIVVLGAGMNGLSLAMLLAQDGHDVTVLERDANEPVDDPEAAWNGWERRGVGQFRMLHFMLPRWRSRDRSRTPRGAHRVGGSRWVALQRPHLLCPTSSPAGSVPAMSGSTR